ncbi:5'-nucleotidase C-terminal domain-containing protein [Tateyamaria sp.]|uniref:5'-nucleotidase C-terminal domain-containing protein n=1 Tax=Tateyamaria sp. TaxID=1929288 RepID=UPI003B2248A7
MTDSTCSDPQHSHAHLRILATTDVHMHMTGWNARQDHMDRGVGLDQLAPTIHAARDSAPGLCLLLDNGDILQGTSEGDLCALDPCPVAHPWPGIATALGYDAVGLGNHDFDYGLPLLERITAQMVPPVLCASLGPGQVAGVLPHTQLARTVQCSDGTTRALRIGVTSVLPPQILVWNHRALHDRVTFEHGVVAAGRAVAALRAGGADVIVLLCHSGLSLDPDPAGENFAAQIEAQVPGIDAMILGHTHRQFPGDDQGMGAIVDATRGTVAGVPAVMPGVFAKSLGCIDLALAQNHDGWQVVGHESGLQDARPDDPDDAITTLAAPSIAAARSRLAEPLTTTGHAIHSFFNLLQSGTEAVLVARALTQAIAGEVAGGSLAEVPLIASVACTAAGGQGGVMNYVDIPKGPVLARHASMISPYPNQIWAILMTGAALYDWAERSAAIFGPTAGRLSPLANPDAPAFNFDTLVGVEAEYDPFAPARFDASGSLLDRAATRVRRLRYKGADIAADDRFLVAMSSYRGAGGGNFPGLDTATQVLRTELDMRKAVSETFRDAPVGAASAPSAWHFVTGLEAQVIIETAPWTTAHLEDIARFDPRPMGLNAAGFLEVQVTI